MQSKLKNKNVRRQVSDVRCQREGFSLVELLVVIGIVAIISTIGVNSFLNFKQSKTLDVEVDTVVAEIRGVMSRARAQQDGLQWWIHFQNTSGAANDFYTICSGAYTTSGTKCDEEGGTRFSIRTLPAGIIFLDPVEGASKDVVFAKATGLPTEDKTIAISFNQFGKTIEVNSNGNVVLKATGLPTIDSPTHTDVNLTSATLGATVSSNGGAAVTDRGTCWGESSAPTDNCSKEGSGSGTFSHNRDNMPPLTTIYYRGYATNGLGTSYSNDRSFTTQVQAGLPTLGSPTHSDVTSTSATLGATVTSDGGAVLIARGTCWGTSANPTGNCVAEGGLTEGAFTHARTGLPSGTQIFYRGYATNLVGTGYSEDSSFTTTGDSLWTCGDALVYAGKPYTTVLIGSQCWMAQHLNVGTMIAGVSNQTNNAIIEKYCYDNIELNCISDGGLYQWDEAMQYQATAGAQGICPADWHIPTDNEWMTLEENQGMCSGTGSGCSGDTGQRGTDEGAKLKVGGSSGFGAILAGRRDPGGGSFSTRGTSANLWSSVGSSSFSAWSRKLNSGFATVYRGNDSKVSGYSVRCLKD